MFYITEVLHLADIAFYINYVKNLMLNLTIKQIRKSKVSTYSAYNNEEK